MLSVEEAQKRIFSTIHPMGQERVPLSLSGGRVLGQEVMAGFDYPPWDSSAMDGYAVCSSDTKGASLQTPCHLIVMDEIPAGAVPKKRVMPGTASKIMTGAPMPEGADAVVIIENAKQEKETVALYQEAIPGDCIRYRCGVVRKGDVVLRAGVPIRPYEIALIASLGISWVSLFQRPRVAILSTGNELVAPGATRESHQIYDSNGHGLAAQVEEAGGVPLVLGIATDSRTDLMEKLAGAPSADFIVISGGVSVGDFDLVKELLSKGNEKMIFWKVAMKPGKPIAFGSLFGKPAFGLPGNPVSAMVTFELFVRPALLYAQGRNHFFRPTVQARLTEAFQKKVGRRYYVRGRLSFLNGSYQVFPLSNMDSSNLLSLAEANALIVLSEEAEHLKAGDLVTVQMLS